MGASLQLLPCSQDPLPFPDILVPRTCPLSSLGAERGKGGPGAPGFRSTRSSRVGGDDVRFITGTLSPDEILIGWSTPLRSNFSFKPYFSSPYSSRLASLSSEGGGTFDESIPAGSSDWSPGTGALVKVLPFPRGRYAGWARSEDSTSTSPNIRSEGNVRFSVRKWVPEEVFDDPEGSVRCRDPFASHFRAVVSPVSLLRSALLGGCGSRRG